MENVKSMKNTTRPNLLDYLCNTSRTGNNLMKQQKDELENLLDGKFLTAAKFSMEIEKIVLSCKGELNYIEAIICYCDEHQIEVDTVNKLISKPLKEKIRADAQRLNCIKRTTRAKLPL